MTQQVGAVLIVDADRDARAHIRRALLRGGFQVRECTEGEEALAAASVERPLAVVLEVELPDVDGFEVCRELRDRFGDDLPVVIVSGTLVTPHDRVAGLLIGADDYLVKPFNADELLARLRRLLTRRGSPERRNDAAASRVLSVPPEKAMATDCSESRISLRRSVFFCKAVDISVTGIPP